MQTLLIEPYLTQLEHWPAAGRHILAQYDEESIIVYQAYRPEIGLFAAEHGYFGGTHFKYTRMSWIKPNFLWMMYRSQWGQSEGQEVILGLRLRRSFFEQLLAAAVPSTWNWDRYAARKDWQAAVGASDVRLQWDPDHAPNGSKQERRAIQLGLRGEMLEAFGKRELLEVLNLSEFVATQRAHITRPGLAELLLPRERVYLPESLETRTQLRLDEP